MLFDLSLYCVFITAPPEFIVYIKIFNAAILPNINK